MLITGELVDSQEGNLLTSPFENMAKVTTKYLEVSNVFPSPTK